MIEYVSAALDEEYHQLDAFDCGVASLNEWLVRHAIRFKNSETAMTYVWTRHGEPSVLAYYSVTPHVVSRDEVSRSLTGGVSQIPAYLLARLALDRSLHGQGLGGDLLRDALTTIVEAADRASGRLIVVDAIDDHAAKFYQKYDFQPVKDNPRRLVIKVATVRAALYG